MIEGSDRSIDIEAVALVRDGVVEDAPASEALQVHSHGAQWVFAMLQHMVGNDEVQRPVGERNQALAVVDAIHRCEFGVGQFRILDTKLLNGHTIDIADSG
jgi:hypothetical protein